MGDSQDIRKFADGIPEMGSRADEIRCYASGGKKYIRSLRTIPTRNCRGFLFHGEEISTSGQREKSMWMLSLYANITML